jgi:hypothetical protein
MAKEAIFKFQDNVVKTNLIKVDRNKVYGWSEEIYTDKSGNICTWATLLNDGVTLISTGGSALKTFNTIGKEISKSSSFSSLQLRLPWKTTNLALTR